MNVLTLEEKLQRSRRRFEFLAGEKILGRTFQPHYTELGCNRSDRYQCFRASHWNAFSGGDTELLCDVSCFRHGQRLGNGDNGFNLCYWFYISADPEGIRPAHVVYAAALTCAEEQCNTLMKL